jgi:hypothetical protein
VTHSESSPAISQWAFGSDCFIEYECVNSSKTQNELIFVVKLHILELSGVQLNT